MKIRPIFTAGIATIVAAAIPASAQSLDVVEFLDNRHDTTASIAHVLWEYAEVGYKETKSAKLLADVLSAEGFDVDMGVAGIPTAFVATYGSDGPFIGILAEYDAPGINQDGVAERAPVEGKRAGHACGHNLFGSGSVSAAIAVKHWLEKSGTPGVVRLYGTPAEEGGGGKVYMVREGLFEDVDTVIHWHASDANRIIANSSLAVRTAKFRFHGVSAHAAAAPDK